VSRFVLTALTLAVLAAQPPQTPPAPPVLSPEVQADRTIVFRIQAPNATTVALNSGDMPDAWRKPAVFVKGERGVWQATTAPVDPGTYRYRFTVDGVAVNDPRNPAISESNTNTWSLVHVSGAEWMDAKQAPHGAVARVSYYSTALKRFRRMHVYTPPGYELGKGKFPVFYLLHGAGDNDDSWTSVGRAGYILDNLIAAGKAKPMIVVMTAGHTSASMGGRAATPGPDEFSQDFTTDVMPYVDKTYRVLKGRQYRAMAGLSMGGMQTMNIGMSHLDQFAYIGVFSSGVFSMGGRAGGAAAAAPAATPPDWEKERAAMLDNAALKKGLKVLWFSTGKDDFLLNTTKATIEMLRKHGFAPAYEESTGGHTWINWRIYLNKFAPLLFQ
jgi:enterochelin esterase-like enzyme